MTDWTILTPDACRAGRALVRWTTADLATKAGLSATTINTFERGKSAIRGGPPPQLRQEQAERILEAFRKARVEITNGDGTGARLKKVGK